MILPDVRDAFSVSAIQRASVAMTSISDARLPRRNRRHALAIDLGVVGKVRDALGPAARMALRADHADPAEQRSGGDDKNCA